MKKILFLASALTLPVSLAYPAVVLTNQYTFDDQSYVDSAGTADGLPTVSAGDGSYLTSPTFVTTTPDGAGHALYVGADQGTLKSGFVLDKGLISTSSGSVSLWVQATDSGTSRWLLNDVYNTGIGVQIPNNPALRVRAAIGGTVSGNLVWTTNTWNHIVFTWNNNFDGLGGNQGAFYFNGSLIGSTFGYSADVDPSATEGYGFYIGGFNLEDSDENLAAQFKGYLDNIQIYTGVLDASEVTYLYNNPGLAVVPEPSAVALFGLGGAFLAYRARRRSRA